MIPRIALATLALAVAVATAAATDTKPGRVLLREDFNTPSAIEFTKKMVHKSLVQIVPNAGPDGSAALRAAYEGFDKGSKRLISIRPLSSAVRTATLSFDVLFGKDFLWVMGGKLHGLGPLHPISGGRERKPGGWSARLMFGSDGKCSTYLYDQTPEKKYGVGKKTPGPVFEKDRWHHIDLQVHLNDPGQANGFARAYIDGKLAIDSQNMRFRARGGDDTLIQKLLFSTFHGGNKTRWAPKDAQGNYTTVHALYDNFVVREGLYHPATRQ